MLASVVQPQELGDSPKDQEPFIIYDPGIVVPYNLRHLSAGWKTGKILARLDEKGLIQEWVPLYLPHYKLLEAIVWSL